jgi:hypothetical protein
MVLPHVRVEGGSRPDIIRSSLLRQDERHPLFLFQGMSFQPTGRVERPSGSGLTDCLEASRPLLASLGGLPFRPPRTLGRRDSLAGNG